MASFFTSLFRTWAASSDHEGVESSRKLKWAPPSSPLASVFKLLDHNGDGLLSVQEMSHGFHKLGVELSPPLLSTLLSSFPLSHPGFLLLHEFEALYASICKDLSMHAHVIAHSCHEANRGAIPCEPHLSHDDIYDDHPCGDDRSSIYCDDDDTHHASAYCDDDIGSVEACNDDDDVRHRHIRLGTSCVVHTSTNLMAASHDNDELSRSGSSDVHMCHDNNDDDGDLLEAFRIFDKNADGFISMHELQSVMCSLGFTQCADDLFCQGILQRVDSNGDGLVDFSEFKHMMINSHFVH